MARLVFAIVLSVTACSSRDRADPIVEDGSAGDAARLDAGGIDAGDLDDAGTDAGATDAGDSDGGGLDAGPTDAAPTDAASDAGAGDACTPPTSDTSAIGTMCTSAADCPSGYVCQPFIGFVLTQSCEIRCETACCPEGTTCQMMADKAGTWMQCNPT